jgi:malate dehydrogenase (oxaloacetate-decarboxylating)(NADP+)
VARKEIDLDEYREQLAFRMGIGEQVRHFILNKARHAAQKKRVVFAEGEENRIIRAAAQIADEGIAVPILVGREEIIQEKIKLLGLDCTAELVNPAKLSASMIVPSRIMSCESAGVTLKAAQKLVRSRMSSGR